MELKVNEPATSQLPTRLIKQDLLLPTCTLSFINRKLQRKGNREKPIFAKKDNGTASNPHSVSEQMKKQREEVTGVGGW